VTPFENCGVSQVAALREAQARQRAASRDERRQCSSLDIAGGHRPPLQMKLSHHRRMSRLDRRGFWHL